MTERLIRELWFGRVQLARPHADISDVSRAVHSILATPTGAYAEEIKQTAERAEKNFWVSVQIDA